MEVHHHPQLPNGQRKRVKEYFLEFLMIFLAVTMGFLAESLREHLNDNSKEKQYIQSFLADLQLDTTNFRNVSTQLFRNLNGQDSLIGLLQKKNFTDSMIKKCYYYFMTSSVSIPLVTFSERTMGQLINSGNMRLIRKKV